MTRLGLFVNRLRDGIVWALPLLAVAGLVALLTTLAIVSLTVIDQRDDQAETLRQVKAATEANRRLIERGNPCLPGDDPASEACTAQRLADSRLADALAAVQIQHDTQADQVDDAVARLVELQERQHGVSVTPRVPSTIPRRPVPRITASGPTPTSPAPSASPTTTPAPPAPTTTACVPNKRERCK